MATPWETQFKDFLQRAGKELRRTGEDMKGEAQRLIEELRDPSRQARMREQLDDLRTWARKASQDAVEAVDTAVKKVEGALTQQPPSASRKGSAKATAAKGAAKAARPAPEDAAPKAPAKAKAAAKKTVGRASPATTAARPQGGVKKAAPKAAPKKAAPKAASPAKAPKAKKTVGRAKPKGA